MSCNLAAGSRGLIKLVFDPFGRPKVGVWSFIRRHITSFFFFVISVAVDAWYQVPLTCWGWQNSNVLLLPWSESVVQATGTSYVSGQGVICWGRHLSPSEGWWSHGPDLQSAGGGPLSEICGWGKKISAWGFQEGDHVHFNFILSFLFIGLNIFKKRHVSFTYLVTQ